MGINGTRNLEEQRREENGVVYFDRGVIEGTDGKKYARFAIQTHFVEVGESAAALAGKVCAPAVPARRRAFLRREGDVHVRKNRAHARRGQARLLVKAPVAFRGHQRDGRRYARAL